MTHLDFLNSTPTYISLKRAIEKMAQSQNPVRRYFEPQARDKLYQTISGVFALDDSIALLDLFDAGMPLDIELEGKSANTSWQQLSTLGAWALEYDAGKCLKLLHTKGLDLVGTQIDKNFGSNLSMAVEKKAVACFDYILTQKNNIIDKTDVGPYKQYLLTDILAKTGDWHDDSGIAMLKRFLSAKVSWSMFTSQEHYYERLCLDDDSHSALDYMLTQDIASYDFHLSHPTAPEKPHFFSILTESYKDNNARLQKIHAFLSKCAERHSDKVIDQYLNETQSLIEKNQLLKSVKIVPKKVKHNDLTLTKPTHKI